MGVRRPTPNIDEPKKEIGMELALVGATPAMEFGSPGFRTDPAVDDPGFFNPKPVL